MKRYLVKSLILFIALVFTGASFGQKSNTLKAKEKKAGWVLRFNGKDFTGWRQCNGTEIPENRIIEDNAMKVITGEGKKPGQGSAGDMVYSTKKLMNFELLIDWKASGMEGVSKEGFIALQDHGYPVWFRNLKNREL